MWQEIEHLLWLKVLYIVDARGPLVEEVEVLGFEFSSLAATESVEQTSTNLPCVVLAKVC